ncbi:MAG: hypothetical protein EB003_10545 [Flavobacteriia bacterium]|nr:hypothetical protein [Flavobacteriia bacterium]
MHNDIQALRQILQTAKTIAVVGLSAQWNRPSFFAAKYMQEHGYKIIFLNAGRQSVTNRCVKIEHARIFGGLHWAGVNTGVISAKRQI